MVPCGDAQVVLGEGEDVVPEPRLEVALHLGQVVVRAVAVVDQLPGRCGRSAGRSRPGHRPPVRRRSSTCASARCQPRGRATTTASGASVRSAYSLPSGEVKDSVPAAASRRLRMASITLGQVGRAGVLEVGEPDLGAGVQGVDRHLGRDWPVRSSRPAGPAAPPVRARPASRPRGRPRSRAGSPAGRSGPPPPACRPGPRAARRGVPAKRWCSSSTKASASGVRISSARVDGLGVGELRVLIVVLSGLVTQAGQAWCRRRGPSGRRASATAAATSAPRAGRRRWG